MFKPAYNANGCLTAILTNTSNVLQVPPAVASYVKNLLGPDQENWTYLKVGSDATGYEIICIIDATETTLVVDAGGRGVDGTVAQTFAIDTPFRYELTALAIADIVDDAATFMTSLQGESPIYVTDNGNGQYVIGIYPLELTSQNETVVITGSYPSIDLAVSPKANGCC